MAWSDPENKSFWTSGWKLFIIGLLLAIGGAVLFARSQNGLTAGIAVVGDLLILASIIVGIQKWREKSKK